MSDKNSADQPQNVLTYKGKPLVRSGKILYFGDLNAKYYSMIQVISAGKENDLDVAQKLAVQLLINDESIPAKDRVLKRMIKDGLYSALDIANIWIEQYSKEA